MKIAVVQAASVLFDVEKTVAKTITLIQKAAKEGAKIVVFPEAFIGGYPRGLSFGAVVGSRTPYGRDHWEAYYENALLVPSNYLTKIQEATRKAGVFVVLGIVERTTENGSLYCTILYINEEGKLIGKHRKLKPTGSERIIWAEGKGDDLQVFDTKSGKIGGLICWENYMPAARMALYQQGIEIYCAPTADTRERWQASMRHIAMEGRCFVIGCNQYVEKKMYPEIYQPYLKNEPEVMSTGGSVVISPLGEVIAGPLWNEEGILYAEVDKKEIIRSKLDFDPFGHYYRTDVFDFKWKYGKE